MKKVSAIIVAFVLATILGSTAYAATPTITDYPMSYGAHMYAVDVATGTVTASASWGSVSYQGSGGCKNDYVTYKTVKGPRSRTVSITCLTSGQAVVTTPNMPSCGASFDIYLDGVSIFHQDWPACVSVPTVYSIRNGNTITFYNPTTTDQHVYTTYADLSNSATITFSNVVVQSKVIVGAGRPPNHILYPVYYLDAFVPAGGFVTSLVG